MRSAALAFDSWLALIPALGLVFFYLSFVGVTERWQAHLRTFILSQLNVLSSASFAKAFDDLVVRSRDVSWGWVGAAVLMYSVCGLLSRVGNSLDRILEGRVPENPLQLKLGFLWLRRGLVILFLPMGLVISLGLGEWIRKDSWLRVALDLPLLAPMVGHLVAVSVTFLVLWNFYLWVPRTRVPVKDAFWAAVLGSFLFEAAKLGFQLYSGRALAVHRIYGVLAVIPLSILWVQVIWMIFLGSALLIRPKERRVSGISRQA